ncbi:RNA polymerase sigma factor FliA [Larsenimonas rhizosphaerae]|uniref:RNA polymerase sigma factor FliA n=1 Tax=Larsenimonas rhizosphaerae TaxID=2944682 RepID=A0AA42CTE9_9GAMM|nr:RNA polymerase sigma factor FliA [Larsenimonas rhizosphaerae]MCM2130424.1 RNA polymerase sigma factor FliA [Larsenimonas rhizosphaerae]MCX2523129.1 RNA polymerase sigma factor FliA [Larsenimonas rhizosphaerae]
MYTAEGKLSQSNVVEQYMPLVRRQALQLQVRLPSSVELDDLIQAGMVGLLDAYNRFDSGQGATFSTYASQRIRGSMIDELRSRDWLPRSVRRTSRDIDRTIHQLEQQNGRAATEREIATALDMSLEDYRKVLTDTNNGYLLPFEDTSTDESEASHVSRDVAFMDTPQDACFANADRQQLTEAIDLLPEREKLLLSLYYQEELNLKEIGAVLGVSESRVCQLHSQAVARLRVSMVEQFA